MKRCGVCVCYISQSLNYFKEIQEEKSNDDICIAEDEVENLVDRLICI
jgi:hypothetical protein